MSLKIVAVSGGFDPIHSGHLAMLRQAAAIGDKLVVGVNSDAWLTRKKGKPFMSIHERKAILLAIKWVDEVWEFDDSDGSACDFLNTLLCPALLVLYQENYTILPFVKMVRKYTCALFCWYKLQADDS